MCIHTYILTYIKQTTYVYNYKSKRDIYIYIYVCLYTYMCIYIYTHIYIYSIFVSMHVYFGWIHRAAARTRLRPDRLEGLTFFNCFYIITLFFYNVNGNSINNYTNMKSNNFYTIPLDTRNKHGSTITTRGTGLGRSRRSSGDS